MTVFKSDKTGLYFYFLEYLERKEMVESDISSHKCCWRFQAIQVFYSWAIYQI